MFARIDAIGSSIVGRHAIVLLTAAAADHADDLYHIALLQENLPVLVAADYLLVHGNGDEPRRHVVLLKKGRQRRA